MVERDRACELEFTRAELGFGLAHPLHQRAKALRVGGVLVVAEKGGAAFDQGFNTVVRGRDVGHTLQPLQRLGRRHRQPPERKRGFVVRHRDAVQLDCAHQRGFAQRNQAALVGHAKHHDVGRQRVAEHALRDVLRVGGEHQPRPGGVVHLLQQRRGFQACVGVAHEGRRGQFMRVHQDHGAAVFHGAQRVGRSTHHHVAGEDCVGLLGVDAHLVELVRRERHAHEGQHRTTLLRKAHEVEHRGLPGLQVRGHRHQRADRDHAGAADAGHQQVEGTGPGPGRRGWNRGEFTRERFGLDTGADALFQHRAFHGHEARAEAVDAGVVLVARALLDKPLAPEVGFHRDHAQAVARHAAVAAALADPLVDEHAFRRVFHLALLAPAALFRGAGLVVDQQGDAGHLTQFSLHCVHLAARVEGGAARELTLVAFEFLDLVRDDHHPLRTFGFHLARDLGDADLAVHRLAAGHRHRVVVEQLVGQRGAGGNGLADREQAGVKVGAVAEVLEDMLLAGEARVADPVDALGAHLDQPAGAALHPARHEMAADAGQRARALGHLGAGVVRATRAEVRLALHRVGRVAEQLRHREVDHQMPPVERGVQAREPVGHHLHHPRGAQLAERGQERRAVGRGFPHRVLARDSGPLRVGQIEQQLLDLALDHRRLFFDHQHLLKPLCKLRDARRLQREHQAHLVDPHPGRGKRVGVELQAAQHFHEIEMRLADGDDAERGARVGHDMFVQRVHPRKGAHRVELGGEARFELQRRQVDRAHMQVVIRCEVHRQREVQRHRVQVHRHARLDHFADRLEADPGTTEPRQRPAVEAELEVLGHVGRVQHRHAPGHHRQVALVRHRRADAAVVVARHHQHTAEGRRAVDVAVFQRVARAVDARALAVPHRGDAIDGAFRVQRHPLGAEAGGGGQVLVDRGQELHAGGVEELLRLPQLLVDHAQRRAAVARDKACGLQATRLVELALHQQQAHERLGAGEEHRA